MTPRCAPNASVAEKRERLLPKELRFLRKYLGLSGADFAAKIGVDPCETNQLIGVPDHRIGSASASRR